MTDLERALENSLEEVSPRREGRLVFAAFDPDFERELLMRLGQLEAKIDSLVGDGQPGRMQRAEERITVLEKNDIRRGVVDRLLNAAIALVISALIAMHDHFALR